MKSIISLLFLFVCISTIAQKNGTYVIRGTTELKEGIAILNDYENPDTVKIIDGKFEFSGKIDRPNMISIEVPPTRSARIIVEPGNITVIHKKDYYILGGSPNNIRFQKIEDQVKPITDKIAVLWSKYNKAEGEERIAIWREYDKAMKEKMVKTMEVTTADGTFAGFMETLPVIRYESATNIKHYLDVFKDLANERWYKNTLEFYKGVARTDIGVQPPDWTLPDQNGKMITLSSLKGKYVLIDFWYAECHWCRKMTPGLIKIYNDLKGKGFEIVSVSIDTKKDEGKWRKAMADDAAPWLQAWDSEKTLPDQYSVQGYPTMFFLDREGKVAQKIIGFHEEPILREFFVNHMSKDKTALGN